MNRLLRLCVFLLLPIAAHAEPPSNESIDAYFRQVDMQRGHEAMLDLIDRAMQQGFESTSNDPSISKEQEGELAEIGRKFDEVAREEMSWEIMRPVYVRMYRDTLTQAEVDGLATFASSPEGKATIEKLFFFLKNPDGDALKSEDKSLTMFLDSSVGKALKDKQPEMMRILYEEMWPHMERVKVRMFLFIEKLRAQGKFAW